MNKKLMNWQNIKIIFHREFLNYFNTPIGYIFLGIFVVLVNFFLFVLYNFWDRGRNAGTLFDIFRLTYIFFVPAITMRLWAEEKKSGTVEMLLTMPFSTLDLILGKYLSALAFLGIALGSTIFFVVTLVFATSPDWTVIIGGYIGSMMLGSAYVALGLFISWLTRDQIVAFLTSFAICIVLWLSGYAPVLQFLGPLREIFAFLSISWHFDSIMQGLLDTRDILYFFTVTALFLYLNKRSMEKWQGYDQRTHS